jgi:hypothetical protein
MALSAASRTQNKLMHGPSQELVNGERLVDEVIGSICE